MTTSHNLAWPCRGCTAAHVLETWSSNPSQIAIFARPRSCGVRVENRNAGRRIKLYCAGYPASLKL
eukprot:scaffold34673_cov23-Tisochrysis_lutea.AAC.2